MLKRFFSALLSVLIALFSAVFSGGKTVNDYRFTVDASDCGGVLPNAVSNINIWDMNGSDQFTNLRINEKYNIAEFVEYVQLMQCTGGNETRDLFKEPMNFDVLDDYDFSRLIDNCRGIVELGAKPHLKLGSVPLKYTSSHVDDAYFGTNVYPPDDYGVYYNYMAAMARELVKEFGREEVLSWRFGVMTEYENSDWFMTADKNPEASAKAYCKLYDYTVDALQTEIGENVFVGAHSMTVTEGLWDERIFIEHCGKGTNYKTGEKGSRVCFLSASFYDSKPGRFTEGKTLTETIAYLKECAKGAGLDNLIFGIDEGRLLEGNSKGDDGQLLTRTVGHTYQAAYDARLYKQLFDIGGDYFSAWSYLSGGLFSGNPTMSYHVADNISKFAGNSRVKVEKTFNGLLYKTEVDAVSAYSDGTLRIMAYNFRNDLDYDKNADLEFTVNVPQFDGKNVTVTKRVVDDDCNYFDEWIKDREIFGIGDDCFAWSPDDPCIESTVTLKDGTAREIYFSQLREKYEKCSELKPVSETCTVENSVLSLNCSLPANGVVFYEITLSD